VPENLELLDVNLENSLDTTEEYDVVPFLERIFCRKSRNNGLSVAKELAMIPSPGSMADQIARFNPLSVRSQVSLTMYRELKEQPATRTWTYRKSLGFEIPEQVSISAEPEKLCNRFRWLLAPRDYRLETLTQSPEA
jgi:hypothetical protein